MAYIALSTACEQGSHEVCPGSSPAHPPGSFGGFQCSCSCHVHKSPEQKEAEESLNKEFEATLSGKMWCAMCGVFGDHTSGSCPELAATEARVFGDHASGSCPELAATEARAIIDSLPAPGHLTAAPRLMNAFVCRGPNGDVEIWTEAGGFLSAKPESFKGDAAPFYES